MVPHLLSSSRTAPAPEAEMPLAAPVSGGWCQRCQSMHVLPAKPAWEECRALMDLLRDHRRLDWHLPTAQADPRCSTDPLFGEAGGKMFGVLCCRDARGAPVVLRAFSGQFNGLWQVDGWVGPIFDVAAFADLVREPEQEIKRLGAAMVSLPTGSNRRRQCLRERRTLSRHLMREIHDLYRLINFRGEVLPLAHALHGDGAPPSGTGDCCGPKLLHYAAGNGLRPEAMAEFYWGRGNASVTRTHGRLYPACSAKCGRILGFQLCGLQ